MKFLGCLCALAWATWPLHASAQAGEAGCHGGTPLAACRALGAESENRLLAVQHIGEPSATLAAEGSATDRPANDGIFGPTSEPATHAMPGSVDADGSSGRGLKQQATSPAHWPDDLTLSPDRPAPMGLRASPDALPSPISGLASWYADHFHGRRTASGEPYSRYEMTAAHRDLPLGTLLHVSNPETGKGVVVRVNDRGPFHGNRVLDVSRAAASVLGLVGAGVGQVDIRLPSSEEVAEFARGLADAAKRPVPQPPPRRVQAAKSTKPPPTSTHPHGRPQARKLPK